MLSSVDYARFWLENVWADEQLMVDALAGLAQRSGLNSAMGAADFDRRMACENVTLLEHDPP